MNVALDKKTQTGSSPRLIPQPTVRDRDDEPIGGALRAAYKSTVDEAIPPEMLDLLSKLK